MAVRTPPVTVEEFERLAAQPANADKRLEYIGGEIIDMVSNNYSSLIGMRIGARLLLYVEERGLGYVTEEAGGYAVAGERYIPDVGFISKARQPEPSHASYNPNAPDLAVEVLSPTDKPADLRIKVIHYLAAGTTVWIVDPEARRIEIYTPGPRVKTAGIEDVIEGDPVLPGFRLAVKDIFAD